MRYQSSRFDSLLKRLTNLTNILHYLKNEQHAYESKLFQSLFIDSYSVMLVIDPETGKIINANKAACSFYGYTYEELTNMYINQINILPIEEIKKEMEKARLGKKNYFNFKHKLKSGEIRDAEVYSGKIQIDRKNYLYSIIHDITEKKKIEQELSETLERLKILTEASYGGIGVHDKGLIIECNQGLCDITGYSKEELIGMNGLLLIAPESRDLVKQNILSGYEKPYEAIGLRKNGEKYPLLIQGRNIRYKGKPVRSTEFRDLTDIKKAEEAAKESKALYKALFDQSPFAVAIIDERTGKFIDFNDKTCVQLEFSREELQNIDLIKIEFNNEHSLFFEVLEKIRQNGKIVYLTKHRTKSGKLIDIETTAQFIVVKEKKFFQFIWRDITEEYKAKKELEESEEKFRKAVMISPDPITINRLEDGVYLLVNEAFCKLFEYNENEVIGHSSLELGIWNNPEQRKEYVNLLKKNNKLENFEAKFRTKSQKILDCIVSASLFIYKDRLCSINITKDISHLKKIENELIQSKTLAEQNELRWKFALEGSKDGVWDWNLKTNKVFFSKQWKAMLGYEEHEISDNLKEWETRVHPDDIQKAYEDIRKHLNNETPFYKNIHRLLCKDGKYKWILDRGIVVEKDETGAPLRMIGTHTDITEQIERERELTQLNQFKDKILTILSHDLRNPFNALLGLSDLLIEKYDGLPPESIREYAQTIYHASKQAYYLLENVLAWSKIQSGKLEPKPSIIKPSETIDDIIEFSKPFAIAKKIDLKKNIFCDNPIYADKEMLRIVLRNLVSNAIKFTNTKGEIVISSEQFQDYLLFTVTDNGIGISKDQLKTLFNSFESLDARTGTSGEKGTGIGLKLCKEFVEKNGGMIWAESEAGKGSSFKFTVPAIKSP